MGGFSYQLYQLHSNATHLEYEINSLKAERIELEKHIAVQPAMVEKVVSNEPWRPVQERVKDTVVQVFSQVCETDLCKPFMPPRQGTALGTGFFINEAGELITNAHVVNQANAIWIQIPSLGKQIIDVELVGLNPDMDIALLRITPEGLHTIRSELGQVSYLELGDSDTVKRSDEILALGYPLGQESLKSTTGVISGREHHLIQMSAPINPGNSGGPSLDSSGKVVGINTANVPDAQNVGYIIPINDLKVILADLYNNKLLRKPFLGVIYINATNALTDYLGNPQPGGCYIADIIKNSTLYKAGVQQGDMIYEINGHHVDQYGEMHVPWSEDKVSIMDYVIRLSEGQTVYLVLYRNGKRKELTVKFDKSELPAIRRIYPGLEDIDYEIIGGMVIMPLTLNHVQLLVSSAPGLARYAEMENQAEPILVVTHIFTNSQLHRTRSFTIGATLLEFNETKVRTLPELRAAIKKAAGKKYLTVKATDNVSRLSASIFAVLPFDQVLKEEPQLAYTYHYAISDSVKELIQTQRTI
jgi:serine protease Do